MIDQTVFNNKKAAYYTLGCKLNFAETSTIGKLLAEQGVRKVRPGEKADICVVNTCSVTELADKKCRQAIRRIGKQHPGAFIVVTGCYAKWAWEFPCSSKMPNEPEEKLVSSHSRVKGLLSQPVSVIPIWTVLLWEM